MADRRAQLADSLALLQNDVAKLKTKINSGRSTTAPSPSLPFPTHDIVDKILNSETSTGTMPPSPPLPSQKAFNPPSPPPSSPFLVDGQSTIIIESGHMSETVATIVEEGDEMDTRNRMMCNDSSFLDSPLPLGGGGGGGAQQFGGGGGGAQQFGAQQGAQQFGAQQAQQFNTHTFLNSSAVAASGSPKISRLLQEVAAQRDASIEKIKRLQNINIELRSKLSESKRQEEKVIILEREVESLQVALESSERIRRQQKDLIKMLQESANKSRVGIGIEGSTGRDLNLSSMSLLHASNDSHPLIDQVTERMKVQSNLSPTSKKPSSPTARRKSVKKLSPASTQPTSSISQTSPLGNATTVMSKARRATAVSSDVVSGRRKTLSGSPAGVRTGPKTGVKAKTHPENRRVSILKTSTPTTTTKSKRKSSVMKKPSVTVKVPESEKSAPKTAIAVRRTTRRQTVY